MDEAEIIAIFNAFVARENCPRCGSELSGGYYEPEEIIKGPSDGVIAEKISIAEALQAGNPASLGLALYIECKNFGQTCGFRDVFYQYYRRRKKESTK